METLKDIIKLGDLPEEQKEQILDAIIYSAEHQTEMYNQTNKYELDQNKTSLTYIKSFLPKIDKTSDRYKNGLVEGVTPDPEQINEAAYSVNVVENGWYYKFTNKMLNHSWHSIKETCTKFLQNLFNSYHDEKIADEYLSVANIITDAIETSDKDAFYESLLNLKSILFVSKATPVDGMYYIFKSNVAVTDKMLSSFKDIITHTTEKNALIKGEIGELAGFRLVSSALQAFEVDDEKKAPFVVYGKNNKGRYPVSTVSYDKTNAKIFFNDLGKGENDPLHQRGSIALYVDGHGFFVEDDSCAIRGQISIPSSKPVKPFDYGYGANLSNFAGNIFAGSNLFPDKSFVSIKVGDTDTVKIVDENGNAVTDLKVISTNSAAATVEANSETAGTFTIAGKGAGYATIIASKENDKKQPIALAITVKVSAK